MALNLFLWNHCYLLIDASLISVKFSYSFYFVCVIPTFAMYANTLGYLNRSSKVSIPLVDAITLDIGSFITI